MCNSVVNNFKKPALVVLYVAETSYILQFVISGQYFVSNSPTDIGLFVSTMHNAKSEH